MLFSGTTKRDLPGTTADGATQYVRLGRRGEVQTEMVGGPFGRVADEGSYFIAKNPTMGTAITLNGATQTAWVATTPNVLIRNNDAANGKRIFLDFVRVTWVTAPTAATSVAGGVIIDSTNRYSSGGTALTIANANMDSANASIALAYGGAITASAASGSVRNVYRFGLSTAIPAVGETYMITFGDSGTGATHVNKTAACGPLAIGPGHSALVYLWLPAQTASGTAEVDVAWYER